ncbi:carbon-nitrogen hydrolase family protein [Marinomonas sp. 15G1-11]|uniref:Carbon-nitrogen hydrolase family protein n=1 Tax=Marinomonas phaeophyticola TaxID=3004091 RepID=A0ABT4JXM2_9GAMM|nr:carbon-nitrogen hydrolase family protein [Marinomonas sp. 15G1-11]MCZ2723028.1 carbon-nitrogen hydrolase family protein [Marinomonas sp. 15G1-11]
MKLCAIQMTSGSEWLQNLRYVELRIKRAAQQGARLVILPENAFLFDGKALRALVEDEVSQSIIMDTLKSLASGLGVWIVVGSHPSINRPDGNPVPNGKVRQSCLVFSPSRDNCVRYDKIHLFDVNVTDAVGHYKESNFIEPGELNAVVLDVDGLKVGLSICYDLRFPELYRALVDKGAELLLVPAAFTYVTGQAHWNTLLRSRAIENQAFVMGVNQCGYHTKTRRTFGHSVCYSPWGDDLGQLGDDPENLYISINPAHIQECKSSMPVLEHRRFM